jgi:hypothetical protein
MPDTAPPAADAAPEAPIPAADPAAAPPAPVVADPAKPADAPAPADKAPDAPVEYSLTLPNDSGLDPAVVERTTAIARELGLSPDHAQKTLNFLSQEAATAAKAAGDAAIQSHQPGGDAWEQQQAEWKTAALADPVLGAGKPEALSAIVTRATQVVATFGSPELVTFLETSGLGSSPAVLKLLDNIGKAMKEDQLVIPSTAPGASKSAAEKLYGTTPSA